ncbi:MAG: hypothetical protein WC455_16795 [Dehalococcoidia bacterium]|jgi:hypothetical protein
MTLKQKALAHYDRMIAWAEKQPETRCQDIEEMEDAIGENYDADYCVYCQSCENTCHVCKLYGKSKRYGHHCCGNLWPAMSNTKTWGTWVKRARRVREYIEKHG